MVLSVTTNSPDQQQVRYLRFNLLNHVVAGRRLRSWFDEYEDNFNEQQIVAYNMFHLCLSFYHVKGPYVGAEGMELLKNLASALEPGIMMATSESFIFFLYHYTVGRYGNEREDQSYSGQIRSRLQEMDTMSQNDNIEFLPLEFEPNFEFVRIPFPFSTD